MQNLQLALESDRYHLFWKHTNIWIQISADNILGRYYRASLIITKFVLAYQASVDIQKIKYRSITSVGQYTV